MFPCKLRVVVLSMFIQQITCFAANLSSSGRGQFALFFISREQKNVGLGRVSRRVPHLGYDVKDTAGCPTQPCFLMAAFTTLFYRLSNVDFYFIFKQSRSYSTEQNDVTSVFSSFFY